MSLPDDVDAEQLIARLAGPLSPSDRAAFRSAAKAAIEQIPCAGEGLIYRVVSGLWRSYFHPPEDTSWDIAQELPRNSKLANAKPVGRDDPRVGRRGWIDGRRRLKAVG
jgi:hypothetical protein